MKKEPAKKDITMSRNEAKAIFQNQVLARAGRIAHDNDMLLRPESKHLSLAILEQLAEAYASIQELVEFANVLKSENDSMQADIEALRRALIGEEKKAELKSVPN